ncbi:hypothetical protein GGH13_009327 [Coemansia sp. S155-1]|nr:hypothetical protein GGH13_009327 [Coemansia sp. S155-1]
MPMAMGMLGGAGGKSSGGGGAGGGLGPLMGMASSFLGGGGGGKASSGGGNQASFFSKILGNVFGSGTRDIASGHMDGLGPTDAKMAYEEIYNVRRRQGLKEFNDDQLGGAAAVYAFMELERRGKVADGIDEKEQQEMLGAVMGEAVNLYEINSNERGRADKELTATAAVHSALKLIDEAARPQQQSYQQQSYDSPGGFYDGGRY